MDTTECHVASTKPLPWTASGAGTSHDRAYALSIDTQATLKGSPSIQQAHSLPRPIPSGNKSEIGVYPKADDRASQLYRFAKELEAEGYEESEPWHLEMRTLRRITFINLNDKLSTCRTRIHKLEKCTEEDAEEIRTLLHQQAEAIRDYEYIRSLEKLSRSQQKKRHDQTNKYHYLKDKNKSGAFWRLRILPSKVPWDDEVRRILLSIMPRSWAWSEEERKRDLEAYNTNLQPTDPTPIVDRLARFIVAVTGALFILIPMYIMALHQNLHVSLITITVAVVLFAIITSIMLCTSNDQTLAATFGYAAVLMVFVGLTVQYQQAPGAVSR